MKNTLLITTLLAAGTLGASAWNNIDDGLSGYNYSSASYVWNDQIDHRGSNSVAGVENWGWDGYKIDLSRDGQYEITFTVYADTKGDSADPMFNIYLAGAKQSIIYGNYIDLNKGGINYLDGYAGVYKCDTNACNVDRVGGQYGTVILNTNIHGKPGVQAIGASRVEGPDGESNRELLTGYHYYTIDIETFADSNQKDLIKFKYNGANHVSGQWSRDLEIQSVFSGIGISEQLEIGYFVAENGGTLADTHTMGIASKTRTKIETPPPAPTPTPTPPPATPDIPEPSAFGLLAGAGALALVASRRRRR